MHIGFQKDISSGETGRKGRRKRWGMRVIVWWLCSSDVKFRKFIFWKIKEAYIPVKDDLIVKKF